MRTLAAIVLVAALAAGCSSDDDDPGPAPTTPTTSTPVGAPVTPAPPTSGVPATSAPATPTVPADVPTTGPNAKASERPPVMPVGATRPTADGARAFARFFLQTVDWGYATTSSTYMRRYFLKSCEQCRIVQLSLDNARRDHKHYIGGRVTVTRIARAEPGGAQHAEKSVRATVNISAIEVIDNAGKASSPDVAYVGLHEICGLNWARSSWHIVSLKASKS